MKSSSSDQLVFDRCKFVWDPEQGTWSNPQQCDAGGVCPALPTATNEDVDVRLGGEGPITLKAYGRGILEIYGGEKRILSIELHRTGRNAAGLPPRDTAVYFDCIYDDPVRGTGAGGRQPSE